MCIRDRNTSIPDAVVATASRTSSSVAALSMPCFLTVSTNYYPEISFGHHTLGGPLERDIKMPSLYLQQLRSKLDLP